MTHATLLHQSAGGGGLVRNGLVYEARFDECRNLLKYTQQFDNAAWTKTDCAITANSVAAPDGTTTADTVTLTVGAAQSLVQSVTTTAATVYTFSIWVKLGTAADLKYAIYDVTNSADIVAATAYGATAEWVRYTKTFTTPAGCVSVSIRPVKDAAQDNGETAYLWGAQLELGSAARAYVPTTDKQLLMDYCRPRKNLLLPNQANACEDGTTTGFAKETTGDAITAEPTGTTAAWQGSYSLKVVTANAASSEGVYLALIRDIKPGAAYTTSCYLKGSGTVRINMAERTDADSAVESNYSSTVTLTETWTRYSVTGVMNATSRAITIKVITPTQQAATFYVDGLQLEEGSTATEWTAPPNIGILGSAIGTTTNDPTITGEGMYFTTDDYILLPEILSGTSYTVMVAGFSTVEAAIHDLFSNRSSLSSTPVKMIIRVTTDDKPYTIVRDGAGVSSVVTHTTPLGGLPFLLTSVRDGNELRLYNKATLLGSDSDVKGTITTDLTDIGTGRFFGSNGSPHKGSIYFVAAWNRALSQAEITRCYNYLKGYLKANRGIELS